VKEVKHKQENVEEQKRSERRGPCEPVSYSAVVDLRYRATCFRLSVFAELRYATRHTTRNDHSFTVQLSLSLSLSLSLVRLRDW